MKTHAGGMGRLNGRHHPRSGRSKPHMQTLLRALRNPLFPLTYLLRNIDRISESDNWRRLPVRSRKAFLVKLAQERGAFFMRVRDRLMNEDENRSSLQLASNCYSPEPASYCDHCGRCCEVASGYPDFPEESKIPLDWREIFGNGLGRGHWFCAFLWEINGSGRSLCAIHPWRSGPCRLFEEEECDYLKADPAFPGPSGEADLGRWYRLLRGLIYS